MMLSLLIFLLLFFSCTFVDTSHKYNIYCTDIKYNNNSFEAADPGIEGRYILKWCTSVNATTIRNHKVNWEGTISSDDLVAKDGCQVYNAYTDRGDVHSSFDIALEEFNCTNICLSTIIDLVYTGCYTVDNDLAVHINNTSTTIGSLPKQLYYISNHIKPEVFLNNDIILDIKSFGDIIDIRIFSRSIPITDFTLRLCYMSDLLNCTSVAEWCVPVSAKGLGCSGPARAANYTIYLELNAPWVGKTVFYNYRYANVQQEHPHLVSSPLAEVAEQAGAGAYWALGAALAALVVVAAIGAAYWWRQYRRRRDDVLAEWLGKAAGKAGVDAAGGREEESDGAVLLLYARDCAPFMAAMAALRDLLRQHTHCPVYDLTEPRLQSRLAQAPGEWVRGALRRRAVRVVLVQSAAAVWVGAGARYRRPAHTDKLLQYTLRLVQDAEHEPRHYRKYYIAALSCVPAEALPTVAPYRRYMLPDHAAQLLDDLSLPSDSCPADTAALHRELQHLESYVQANPNYIQEELLYVP